MVTVAEGHVTHRRKLLVFLIRALVEAALFGANEQGGLMVES